ncbi:MAG: ABC transporter permease subunit [Fusobacteria bacterium]|nr:ABC transporter permease subunit [Fusobacteriota bacterium]
MLKSKSQLLFFLIWFIPILVFAIHFFDFSNFISIISQKTTLNMVVFTLFQALISTVIAFLIAILPSFYASFNKNFLSKLLSSTLFIPFFFPVISATTTFVLIGHQKFFHDIHFLFSLKAIIVANVFFNAPIFIYYLKESFSKIPKTLHDLSVVDGANKNQFICRVLIPLVTPAIFRSGILCFAYCFTNFAIILNLGGLKFSTLEVSIATTLLSSYNFSEAFTYGFIQLIILSTLFYFISSQSSHENEIEQVVSLKTTYITTIISVLFCLFEFAIVALSLIFSFYNFYLGTFSLLPFKELFSLNFNQEYPVLLSFFTTVALSFVTSIITVIVVYFIIKSKTRFTNFFLFSTLGISNAFLAICLIYLNILYNIPIPILLVLGYLIIATPIAYAFISPHFESFPKNIVESAYLSGANRLKLFLYIEWPILKSIFIATFLQIFTIIFGEFTLTYTMQIYSTLPTLSLTTYMLSSSHNLANASALSGISLFFIIILYFLSLSFINRFKN